MLALQVKQIKMSIVNKIGDEGSKAIFNNARYLVSLEILNVNGISIE